MTTGNVIKPTIWQQNAEAFASQQPAAIDQERHAAVRESLALIVAGRPGKARFVLARSVMRQNRIAGGGTIPIHPGCPCGGRCPNGSHA